MIFKSYKIVIVVFVFLISAKTNAQNSFVLSGIVKDAATGEALPGVSIFEESTRNGTITNENGFYSLKLKKGEHKLTFSFIGYEKVIKTVNVEKNNELNIVLTPGSIQLEDVVVSAEKPDENVTSTEVSIEKLNINQIKVNPHCNG